MSKAFLITINNPNDVFDPASIPGCVYAIWQLERGERGEPTLRLGGDPAVGLCLCDLESLFCGSL